MKKHILTAALLVASIAAYSQSPVDTTKLKASLTSPDRIAALYNAIGSVNKGLPASASISAAEASNALNELKKLSDDLVALYTERNKPKPEVKPVPKAK